MTAPPHRPGPRHSRRPDAPVAGAAARLAAPLSEREFDELQALLDRVPAPLESLDVSMLDGYLCGVLLQPRIVPVARWLPHITDVDGRALPAGFDATRLHALAQRRHAELNAAIIRRQWFDPWVFELGDDEQTEDHAPEAVGPRGGADAYGDEQERDEEDAGTDDASAVDAVYPWVAGFATALELFPDLMALPSKDLTEPLALVYRHLAPDDLEDADELLAEIDTLAPPEDLTDAVEGLVRATLLLADVSRPIAAPAAGPRGPARRRGPPSNR